MGNYMSLLTDSLFTYFHAESDSVNNSYQWKSPLDFFRGLKNGTNIILVLTCIGPLA